MTVPSRSPETLPLAAGPEHVADATVRKRSIDSGPLPSGAKVGPPRKKRKSATPMMTPNLPDVVADIPVADNSQGSLSAPEVSLLFSQYLISSCWQIDVPRARGPAKPGAARSTKQAPGHSASVSLPIN